MKSQILYILVFCQFFIWVIPGKAEIHQEHRHSSTGTTINQFLENRGQWPSEQKYRLYLSQGMVIFNKNSVQYVFTDKSALKASHGCTSCPDAKISVAKKGMQVQVVEQEFLNTYNPTITATSAKGTVFNFYFGQDPEKHVSGLRPSSSITYNDIYPETKLIFYVEKGRLKYDFVLNPTARVSHIRWRYVGGESSFIEKSNLMVKTSLGNLQETIPAAYYVNAKQKTSARCRYVADKNSFGFSVEGNNAAYEQLVIDPLLIFSTFSGSEADNWGNTATFDEDGNLYSGGISDFSNFRFPVTPGAYQLENAGSWDVAILKFDSSGHDLLYATYLGGSFAETPQSMIVNNNNELIILGATSSPDFPLKNPVQADFRGGTPREPVNEVIYENGADLFIAKLSADGGNLLGATFLGGSENDGINFNLNPLVRNYGDQYRGDVVVDANDQVYLVSNTTSADFPLKDAIQNQFGGGSHDGVVVKLSAGLDSLIWSTYLGGSGSDAAYSVKISQKGEVYLAGGTNSINFPVSAGSWKSSRSGNSVDGFATHLSQQPLKLQHSTYLGTSEYDQAYFIDLDQDQNVYLLGQTSGDYPVSSQVYHQGNGQFVHKLDPALSQTFFSTMFGSENKGPDISLTAFLVNECGNILISGWGGILNGEVLQNSLTGYVGGSTAGLPVTRDAFQRTTDSSDFYLMVLAKDARSLLYGTYFGGTQGRGEHVDGGTSRFDKRGIVYQAVCACRTPDFQTDFPTTPGAWSNSNLSKNCNNAVFKFDLASLSADFVTNSPDGDQPGLKEGCFPLEILFLNQSIGGKTYSWDFGNGQQSFKKDSISIIYDEPGFYNVNLVVFDENTCTKVDFASAVIRVLEQDFRKPDDQVICNGSTVRLEAGGGVSYEWSPPEGLSNPKSPDPVASPAESTTYNLRMVNENNCVFEGQVQVEVLPEIIPGFQVERNQICGETPRLKFINETVGADRYLWSFGNGTTSTEENPDFQYVQEEDQMFYQVSLSAQTDRCQEVLTLPLEIRRLYVPNVFSPNGDNKNEFFTISSDQEISLKVYNRWGREVYYSADYQNQWKADNLNPGVYYYQIRLKNDDQCKGWVQVLK